MVRLDESAFVRVSAGLTLTQFVVTLASLLGGDRLRSGSIIVFVALFFLGIVGLALALLVALGRSRYEQIELSGAFFLAGSVVDPTARRWLYLELLAQSIIGVGAASLAPFTAAAFSILVPLAGMALIALTGSKLGAFQAKPESEL